MQPQDATPADKLCGPPLFTRREPQLLSLNPSGTTLTIGDTKLPTRNLTLSPGLRSQELVLTTRRTVISIAPQLGHEESFRLFQNSLTLTCMSPPGYRLLCEIGHGAFGVVYKALCRKTSSIRAVKMVSKARLNRENFPLHVARRELVISQHLSPHPSVVRVHEVQENASFFVVVMDLANGGTLFEYAAKKRVPLNVVAHIMLQLLNAIAHLHSHNVIHRDVKLENILVKDAEVQWPEIILVDLGLAIDDTGVEGGNLDMLKRRVGTEYAQAPEMVRPGARPGYGPGVDVWACGIVLFALLYGRLPWVNDRGLQIRQMDMMLSEGVNGRVGISVVQSEEEKKGTPWVLHSLLCGLLQPDVNRRLTARAALEHTIFASLDEGNEREIAPSSPRSLRDATFTVLNVIRAVEKMQMLPGVDCVRG